VSPYLRGILSKKSDVSKNQHVGRDPDLSQVPNMT
jgi:hypothetical protein